MPPFYPLFLAAIRSWAGGMPWLYKSIQIVMSALTVMLVYAITNELSDRRLPSFLAGLCVALYPPFVGYAVSISTVTFETLFVVAGIWAVLRAVKDQSLAMSAIAGLMLALAALTRATWLALVPLVLVWVMGYRKSDLKARGSQVAVLALAVMLTLTPWVVRNYQVHGKVVVTSTNGGLNFWIGNNPKATGEYIFPTRINDELVRSVADWPELERDRFFYTRGLKFVRRHPVDFLSLLARKTFYFFVFRPNIGSSYSTAQIPAFEWVKMGFIASWLGLFAFAILGIRVGTLRWREHALLAMPLLASAATSIVYFVGTRFRTPAAALVAVWSSVGLSYIVERLRSHGEPSQV
jgi:hypothetical protein